MGKEEVGEDGDTHLNEKTQSLEQSPSSLKSQSFDEMVKEAQEKIERQREQEEDSD